MGDTKKDKVKGKYNMLERRHTSKRNEFIKKLRKQGYSFSAAYNIADQRLPNPWDMLTPDEKKTIVNYSKGPSWHTRLFSNIPKKRADKHLCRKIIKGEIEDAVFSLARKPHEYYW